MFVGNWAPHVRHLGPTCNKASRLESAADAGTIAVSSEVRETLEQTFEFDGPYELDLKGLGQSPVWHLVW
ncbi:MAG: hypothetical protein JNM34_06115 [Chthonomonadaceae bacterium]|nr:hypothetical protein [Chthonomonadaceae bacterium]